MSGLARLGRPLAVVAGVTLLGGVMGLQWGDASLVGLLAGVLTGLVALLGAAESDPWPRHREPFQPGTRRDVMALTWSFIGREGRVSEFAVRRVRQDATRRLAQHGLVLPGGLNHATRTSPEVDDATRARVREMLGDRAWAILTTPGGTMPTIGEIAHCVRVVEALQPPDRVSPLVGPRQPARPWTPDDAPSRRPRATRTSNPPEGGRP